MKRPTPNLDSGVLAVIHRAGRSWSCLAANIKGPKPAIAATREIPVDRDSMLEAWLDEQQAHAVLCVVPASSVICRNCTLPNAAPQQLEQALALQAEAHLLGVAPPHRVAMAVLPGAAGETSRSGLVLAWPESIGFELPPTSRPVRYVADIAAVAALLNGQRPTELVLWLDRADGSIALAITHANGAVFRATREDASTTEAWCKSAGRIVAETALSVGHTGAFVESLVHHTHERAASLGAGQAALMLPAELQSAAAARLEGAGGDAAWWSRYGIAAGALLARTGPLAPLSQMLAAPPIEVPTMLDRAVGVLSRPRTAAALVVIAVLAIFLGPLVLHGSRLAILKMRFGNVNDQVRQADFVRNTFDLYQELQRQNSWPMTKLLADICTNAPVGIELESIRLEGGKEFSVGGTAIAHQGLSAPQVLALFQENLRKDNLFTNIRLDLDAPNNLGVHSFDISGRVSQPYASPTYPEDRDFRAWTLAERLYGRRGSETPVAMSTGREQDPGLEGDTDDPDDALAALPAEESSRSSARGHLVPDSSLGRANPGSDSRTSGGVAPSRDIPPPITQTQIDAMNEAEARQHLWRVAAAEQYANGDDRERLRTERKLLMDHLKKVKGS